MPPNQNCVKHSVHPFFTKGQDKAPAQQGTFQWLSPLGPNRSCLHGINLHPTASCKVAALDLDGTIISSAHRGKVVEGKPLWEWWRSFVPDKLKTLIEEG
jgi:bifunctional polynucleotide phosphatase/kinase